MAEEVSLNETEVDMRPESSGMETSSSSSRAQGQLDSQTEKTSQMESEIASNEDKKILCDKCTNSKKFKSAKALANHVYGVHGRFKCPTCSKEMPNRNRKRHLDKCGKPKLPDQDSASQNQNGTNNTAQGTETTDTLEIPILPAASACEADPSQAKNLKKTLPKQDADPDILQFPFLDPLHVIRRLPKRCKMEGFEGACEIEMNPNVPLMEFPAFVRAWYQSGLAKSGAILVVPPSTLVKKLDVQDLKEKMNTTKIKSLQKLCQVGTGESKKSFKIVHPTGDTVNLSIKEYKNRPHNIRPAAASADQEDEDAFKYLFDEMNEYAAHVKGSFFDKYDDGWNLRSLNNDLNDVRKFFVTKENGKRKRISAQGKRTPFLHVGKWATWFLLQVEEDRLGSISYNHHGASKIWFVVPPEFEAKVQERMALEFPGDSQVCPAFLRHKNHLVLPELLDDWGIPYSRVEHLPGTFLVLAAGAFHFGYNAGFNIAETVNFHTFDIYPHFVSVQHNCYCAYKQIFLPREHVVKFYQGVDGHKLFLNDKLRVKVPFRDELGLVKVSSDVQRYADWIFETSIQRARNNGINPFTAKPYPEKGNEDEDGGKDDDDSDDDDDDDDAAESESLLSKDEVPKKKAKRMTAVEPLLKTTPLKKTIMKRKTANQYPATNKHGIPNQKKIIKEKTITQQQEIIEIDDKEEEKGKGSSSSQFYLVVDFTGKKSKNNHEIVQLHLKKDDEGFHLSITIENIFASFTLSTPNSFQVNLPKWDEILYQIGNYSKFHVLYMFELVNGKSCRPVIVDACLYYLMKDCEKDLYLGLYVNTPHEIVYAFREENDKILPITNSINHVAVLVQFEKEGQIGHFLLVVFFLNTNIARIYDSAPHYYEKEHQEIVSEIAAHIYKKQQENYPKTSSFSKTWNIEVANAPGQKSDGLCGGYVVHCVERLIANDFQTIEPITGSSLKEKLVWLFLHTFVQADTYTVLGSDLKSLLKTRVPAIGKWTSLLSQKMKADLAKRWKTYKTPAPSNPPRKRGRPRKK